jgi:GMP synthase-like glutamine amidotransferase
LRALVLQHIACETPGLYEDILLERHATIERVELDEGEPLPNWRGFDLIIAMGGPMSVNDDASLPWLSDEKRLIGEAVRAGMPFFGACLGLQLLAAALGARVYPGPSPEVGLLAVSLTANGRRDPVTSGLPDRLFTVQFHGDTFDLPEGAVQLARSATYPNQAFRWKQAYGVQFHLEVSTDMVRAWLEIPEYAAYLERALGPGGGQRLLRDVDSRAGELTGYGRRLFESWLDATVSSPAPTPA